MTNHPKEEGGLTHRSQDQNPSPQRPESSNMVPKATVLLPLYIFPDPGAWDVLHSTISANPALNFTIILNPHSGPGYEPWWPNADYIREMPKLNAQPNVKTVGYVMTNYTKRDINEVYRDIQTYADRSWDLVSGLGVDGIFFDETPNLHSDAGLEYLNQISDRVKWQIGILGERLVIHNPGTSVEAALASKLSPAPDIVTVAERDFLTFNTTAYQDWLATNPFNRTKTSYMVYGTPAEQVYNLTMNLRERAQYLFVTDVGGTEFYHSFGTTWKDYITAMHVS